MSSQGENDNDDDSNNSQQNDDHNRALELYQHDQQVGDDGLEIHSVESTMSADMQDDAIRTAKIAFRKFSSYDEIAKYIRAVSCFFLLLSSMAFNLFAFTFLCFHE